LGPIINYQIKSETF